MSSFVGGPWKGDEAEFPADANARRLEEQLVLRDRILGLEAELAELSAGARPSTPSEQLSVEQRLIEMRSSFAYRLGSAITNPRRVTRRLFRR